MAHSPPARPRPSCTPSCYSRANYVAQLPRRHCEDAPGLRRFRVSIDRDGRYAFPPLPAGNWQLDLRSGEARLRSEAFLLAPGAEEVRRDRLRLRESKR